MKCLSTACAILHQFNLKAFDLTCAQNASGREINLNWRADSSQVESAEGATADVRLVPWLPVWSHCNQTSQIWFFLKALGFKYFVWFYGSISHCLVSNFLFGSSAVFI